jgi:hypothetical protein
MQDVRRVLLYGSTFPYWDVVGAWLKVDDVSLPKNGKMSVAVAQQ